MFAKILQNYVLLGMNFCQDLNKNDKNPRNFLVSHIKRKGFGQNVILWGLLRLHFQVTLIIKQSCEIYKKKKHEALIENMVISALFDDFWESNKQKINNISW